MDQEGTLGKGSGVPEEEEGTPPQQPEMTNGPTLSEGEQWLENVRRRMWTQFLKPEEEDEETKQRRIFLEQLEKENKEMMDLISKTKAKIQALGKRFEEYERNKREISELRTNAEVMKRELAEKRQEIKMLVLARRLRMRKIRMKVLTSRKKRPGPGKLSSKTPWRPNAEEPCRKENASLSKKASNDQLEEKVVGLSSTSNGTKPMRKKKLRYVLYPHWWARDVKRI